MSFSADVERSTLDRSEAYRCSHDRIRTLVDESTANVEVQACPGWTVKDVIAHLAGFFTAYQTGGQDAFGPGWGEREVESRRDRSLEDCLAEWGELLENPGDLFESNLGPVAVSDVLAHEQDIRTALGRPGARDDENIIPSVEMALSFLSKGATENDLPTLRVVTDDLDRHIGKGEPACTLRTSTFELFRTLHGRRTLDQVRAMEWEGDPEPWLPALFLFGPTGREVERATDGSQG